MASINGSVTLAGDPDDWIACAFDADTHAFVGSAAVADDAYEITGLTAGKAYMIACRPKTGGTWQANNSDYAFGDYAVPTDPEATPYIFKITAPEGASAIYARYWRVNGFVTNRGDMGLYEIQLHNNSGNQNSSATVTGTMPSVNSIANVIDGNLTTSAFWSTTSNLYLKWDFGASNQISGIKMVGANADYFPSELTVQYSDDDLNWTTQKTITGISYPGSATYTDLLNIQDLPITGSSEPEWPTTPGNTIADNDYTWTNMGQLVQPLMQGPLIAV